MIVSLVASLTLIEWLLIVCASSLVTMTTISVWVVARLTERKSQSEERHRLRAERDSYRLLLEANGIDVPNVFDAER